MCTSYKILEKLNIRVPKLKVFLYYQNIKALNTKIFKEHSGWAQDTLYRCSISVILQESYIMYYSCSENTFQKLNYIENVFTCWKKQPF